MIRLILSFTFLFLIYLNFQLSSHADDIKDFEIEGMSVGDSLLDHFNEENIIKELNSEYVYRYKSKFVRVGAGSGEGFQLIKKTSKYDDIGITIKVNDKKYKIYSLSGRIFCDDGIKDCFTSQTQISNDLKNFLGQEVKFETWERTVPEDQTNKSKIFGNDFIFKNSKGIITVAVYDYSKSYSEKTKFYDHAAIAIHSGEFLNFLNKN